MADYKNWDDLAHDVKAMGDLACYHLDILLEIYGSNVMTAQISADIIKSLKKRGLRIQPDNLTHVSPKDYVRIYHKNTTFARLIEMVNTISLDGNLALRKLARSQEKNDDIDRLIELAKTIVRD